MKRGWYYLLTLFIVFIAHSGFSQKLPAQFRFSEDGRRLIIGGIDSEGFYDESSIKKIYLEFEQTDYWQQMLDNYDSKTDILASLSYDGQVLDSVGVRFKGQTSFKKTALSLKKSFSITLDYIKDDQNIDGYETLNLNNCYQDPSFLHEVLYLNLSRNHIPSARANYVELFINGVSWGLYPNIQQLNSQHAEEWFLDKDAIRWRCEAPDGLSSGSSKFGAGFSTLNYLGDDANTYAAHYTLKNDEDPKAWSYLMTACEVLNNAPLDVLEDALRKVFDVDGALWFLAHEILFIDDDGYVNKGGMDYYVYYDVATGRLRPIEYDGNSCMEIRNNARWVPLYKVNNTDFPLMNRLFAVPALKERYLAHLRTVLETSFSTEVNAKIDAYVDMIRASVLADTMKIYTNQEFEDGITDVKGFFSARKAFMTSNLLVKRTGLTIDSVWYETNGINFHAPDSTENVCVKAKVSGGQAEAVYLYYGDGLMGTFQRFEIFDNGLGCDEVAGDLIFSGEIPKHAAGTYVRYYIETVKADAVGTRTYAPAGAEHDVYVYRVNLADLAERSVVINEIMPSNKSSVVDQNGDFDDWIELYNPGKEVVDLSGFFLSDDPFELAKWQFPQGTMIQPDDYLIVWADKDIEQNGLHADFKLSLDGEDLILSTPDLKIVDEMFYSKGTTDVSYARIPNGTGPFTWQNLTFNANNSMVLALNAVSEVERLLVYPNPANDLLYIDVADNKNYSLTIYNMHGIKMHDSQFAGQCTIDVSKWNAGIYILRCGDLNCKVFIK